MLQSEIDRLSERHQTQSFLPHITAARLPVKTLDEIVLALDGIAQQMSNYTISFGELKLSSNPYQNMVIHLNYTPFLSELSEAVDRAFQEPCSKNEFHCSLLYGYTSISKLKGEKSAIEKRLPDNCFAYELAVVLLNGGSDEWRVIYRKKLRK